MMRLLAPRSSLDRIGAKIAAVAPSLEIAAIGPGGQISLAGTDVRSEGPFDIVWLNIDANREKLIDPMFAQALASPAVWMQTFNAGLDDPRYQSVLDAGGRLTNSDAQGVSIAEYVMAEALAEYRSLAVLRDCQAGRRWERHVYRELSETTWLIVGFGAIGRETARRARAFGAHILALRQRAVEDSDADEIGTPDKLFDFLPRADIVVLACPLTSSTRDMADERFFNAMKPGSMLINIARGGLVREDALVAGLAANKPAVAALDVFAQEPLPATSPLWSHPQIRVSAHNSAGGAGTRKRGDALFLDNLHRFIEGTPLRNQVKTARA